MQVARQASDWLIVYAGMYRRENRLTVNPVHLSRAFAVCSGSVLFPLYGGRLVMPRMIQYSMEA